MEEKVGQKLFAVTMATLSMGSVFAGSYTLAGINANAASKTTTLKLWTASDAKPMIEEMQKQNPAFMKNVKIKQTVISYENFQTKLDKVFGTDKGPDLVILDAGFVKKYVNSGKLTDLNKYGAKTASKDSFKFTKDIGKYKSQQAALSYQAAPGALYYRTDLLEKYLGIAPDDTTAAQEAFSSWDNVKKTAETIKEKSGGKAYVFSSLEEIYNPFIGARKTGWVKNNKLVIDKKLTESLDVMKDFVDEGLVKNTQPQTGDWFAGMSQDDIVSYSLPSWGLFYWLAGNSKSDSGDTTGKWHIVEGPQAYQWGGSWIGAVKGLKNEKLAAKLAVYFTTDKKFLKYHATKNIDFASDQKVDQQVAKDLKPDDLKLLGGQNPFDIYLKSAKNINGSIVTQYDQDLQSKWINDVVNPYANGKVTKEKAIANFKKSVANAYPDIKVK
jgi:ABC-type glycerol-3-phosphate transport system substrate-binding protein